MNVIAKPLMDKSTTFATYLASISTAVGGYMSLNNVALLIGILVTLALGYIQWKVWRNRLKQDAEHHEARMAALRNTTVHVVNSDRI